MDTLPLPVLTLPMLDRVAQFQAAMVTAHLAESTVPRTSPAFVRIRIRHDPFPGLMENQTAGQGVVLDYGRLAATIPAVAHAFTTAQLPPADYLPFVMAVTAAEATDSLQLVLQGFQDQPATVADPDGTGWRNVEFLRAHRAAIDALGIDLPKIRMNYNHGEQSHFLEAMAGASHRYQIHPLMDSTTGFPIGLLDSAEAPATDPRRAPWRVLFIGNSLTYFNTMPRLFASLAAAGLHRRVVVGLVSVPAASPFILWTTTDVQQVIAHFPWDAVVVQLKPTGENTGVNFPRYARLFAQTATQQHARTVLWTQFRDPDTDPTQQAMLNQTLTSAATAAGAAVVPVPTAWDIVLKHGNDSLNTALYYDLAHGNTHPSALGSYLIALTMYHTLTGVSPVGLPRTIQTLTVPAPTAALLQHAAATAQP